MDDNLDVIIGKPYDYDYKTCVFTRGQLGRGIPL